MRNPFLTTIEQFNRTNKGKHIMAKDVKKITQARPTFRFTKVNLTEADKKALSEMTRTPDQLVTDIDLMISQGYKVTITHDEDQHLYVVSQIGNDLNRSDCNLCVTSRHSTMFGALLTAMYKWSMILSGEALPEPAARSAEGQIWD